MGIHPPTLPSEVIRVNQKKPYKSDWTPNFLHEVEVSATGKTFRLVPDTQVSVIRRPGLIAGRYRFLYGERSADGTLLLQVEGPVSRQPRRRIIRESDIKQVHVKTRPRTV